jgi:hypothetical protein
MSGRGEERRGKITLMLFHEVAKGPVSASPSPTMQVVMRSGLSMTDPKATDKQYPSSPPS